MAELCDIYDIDGNKTGETFIRGEMLKKNQYHLGANVWIINSKFEVLIQKRSKYKSCLPDIWATHGGAVSAGETSFDACIREAHEEIGIVLQSQNVKYLSRGVGENLIMDNYIVLQEFDIESAALQVEEVSEIKWATLQEVKQMTDKGEFFKYKEFQDVIRYINELRYDVK